MKIFVSNCLIISILGLSDSVCPRGGFENSQPQFGPKCMYRCHCVGDVQCDSVTGECPAGCAAGWMGPGCQYGDIAYNKQVQQLLYGSNMFINGRNATDGLLATCVGPTTWIEVDLNAIYKISGLVISSNNAVSLQGFEVVVRNNSFYPPSDIAHTCFQKSTTDQLDTVTHVVCTKEIIGQYLVIRTQVNARNMTLCDVRVYGGRSLAYRRSASQSTTANTDCCGNSVASLALDGNDVTNFTYGSCTHTEEEQSPWWRVNLELVYDIKRIILYGRQEPCCVERLSGFSVSFATNNSFSLVFKYPEKTPMVTTEITTLSEDVAQRVEISLKNRPNATALTLCEVYVFGECQDNLCGWICETYCYCEGPIDKQNKILANCPGGCKPGWWGNSCNNTCDTNCKGKTCNQSDGHCVTCFLGKWGYFCDYDCTNCLNGTGCETSSGICTVGCLTGYYGMTCNELCGQCGGDGSCNRDTGTCYHGCQLGWKEDNCTIGLQEEQISTESNSGLSVGIPVGVIFGVIGLSAMIILVAVILRKRRKRAPETSQIENTYDQIDTTRIGPGSSSEYTKLEEMGLSSVTPKESTYENTLPAKNLIPKCEFKDIYQTYISLDETTGELKLLSVFKDIEDPDLTKTEVTCTRRADDYIDKSYTSYVFETAGKKEFTILSDITTTSEAFWRIALERNIHLIIIIGENRIHFKPKVQVEIGLIQMECVDITVERDLLLCNLNLTRSEKEGKVRNVQVILSAEECSLCISSINKMVDVLRKRLHMRQGIEAFNTLINCMPDAKDGECFVASLLIIDFMERSGNIDIMGIIEAMRKEKHDVIDTFDKFKFCHDVIFKWIVDEENKRRIGAITAISQ